METRDSIRESLEKLLDYDGNHLKEEVIDDIIAVEEGRTNLERFYSVEDLMRGLEDE